MKLKDKVVVVTGSTRGIGRAIAEACAAEGARVTICSRHATAVEQTCEAFTKRDFQVSGIVVDVSVYQDLERLLQHSIENWGRVDVWINNAGLSSGYLPLDDMTEDEIMSVVNVNLGGTLKACHLIIPYFIKNGGILINLSGRGGRGEASPFLTTYAATKAAVASLTKSLASENKGYPISIHSVLPGMVATDFYTNVKTSPRTRGAANIPYALKAVGVPVEVVARKFVEIAAQEPGKLTGKTYSLLGGWRMMRAIGLFMWFRATGKMRDDIK